jgi:uncharacterized protein (TIGR02266 family)
MFVSNRIMNLSRGGLFMRTERPLPLHSDVALTLLLPHARIEALGRVVWNYDMARGSMQLVSGSGIRFVDMAPEDRRLLEGYLSELGPSQGSKRDRAARGAA